MTTHSGTAYAVHPSTCNSAILKQLSTTTPYYQSSRSAFYSKATRHTFPKLRQANAHKPPDRTPLNSTMPTPQRTSPSSQTRPHPPPISIRRAPNAGSHATIQTSALLPCTCAWRTVPESGTRTDTRPTGYAQYMKLCSLACGYWD